MPKLHGFNYTRPAESLLDGDWHPDVQPLVESIVDLLNDQQLDLNDSFTLGLQGTRGASTITAAAGGVAVTFTNPYDGGALTFQRAPAVFCQIIGGAGAHVVVKASTTTTTGFTAQVYVGAVEQGAGSYTFTWLAII